MPVNNRRTAPVFNKNDRRMYSILKKVSKKDIIKIYDIDVMLLFRLRNVYSDVDYADNYRPYTIMNGEIEGVFLDPKKNLLFPNHCNQLDFRKDFPVYATITYDLQDNEIGVLSRIGMFHNGFEFQGKPLNSVLEIPWKIDYYAISNTPITYIDIQDQYHIVTNSKKTGYTTLMSMFTPFDKQAAYILGQQNAKNKEFEFTPINQLLRERENTDKSLKVTDISKSNDIIRDKEEAASFVERANRRIQDKLNDTMKSGDVFKSNKRINKSTADILSTLSEETEKVKTAIEQGHDDAVSKEVNISRSVNSMIGLIDIPTKANIPEDALKNVIIEEGKESETVENAIDNLSEAKMNAENVAKDVVSSIAQAQASAERDAKSKERDERKRSRDQVRESIRQRREKIVANHNADSDKNKAAASEEAPVVKQIVKGDILTDPSINVEEVVKKFE